MKRKYQSELSDISKLIFLWLFVAKNKHILFWDIMNFHWREKMTCGYMSHENVRNYESEEIQVWF